MKTKTLIGITNNRLVLFIIVLYLILSGLLLNQDLPLEGDSSIFFNLGKSLSSGMGYKDLYFPGNPLHVQYPYFYPFFLSLCLLILPETVIGLKLSSVLFGIASLVAIRIFFYDECKNRQDIKFSMDEFHHKNIYFLALLVISTNLWFLSFSIAIIPEMAYLFFSMLSIIIVKHYVKEHNLVNKYLWLLLICLGVVFYTKTIGFSLLLAVVGYLFFIAEDYKKGLLITCWELLLVLLWLKFFVFVPKQNVVSQDYITQLSPLISFSFISTIKLWAANFWGYFKSITSLFSPAYFLGDESFEGKQYFLLLYTLIEKKTIFSPDSLPLFYRLIILSIGGITCFGFLNRMKNIDLSEVYVLCYLLIILICPSSFFAYSSNRYLFSLFPFLIFYFFSGIILVLRKMQKVFNKKIDNIALYGTGVFLLISNLLPTIFWIKNNISYVIDYKYLSIDEKREYHPFWLWDYFSSAYWVKKNTLPGAIIMYVCPQAFYLYSHRKTVFFNVLPYDPRGTVLEEIKLIIKEKKVNYIVESYKKQEEIITRLNDDFKNFVFVPLVKFLDGGIIYKVANVPSKVKLLNIEGVYCYNRKNYNEAILKFKESIKIKPTFVTYYNLGRCYESKRMFSLALQMYKEAIQLQSNYELAKENYEIVRKMDNK